VASKELYATGETKECLKAQQVPCPYRANEKPPAKLVDIYCSKKILGSSKITVGNQLE